MSGSGLKSRVLTAFSWSVGLKFGFQMLTWVMTLAVIRVLSPEDYGLMAISQSITTVMMALSDLGLGGALLQRKDVPPRLVAAAFGLLLLVSTGLTVTLAAAAYPIGAWYGDGRLVTLIQLSSLGFVFNALSMLPRTMLAKYLRTREVFVAELLSGLVGAVVTTALAFSSYGVWSLIAGWLVSNIVRQVAFAVVGREFYVRPRLDLQATRPLLAFGVYSTLEYMAFMLATNLDMLIVSRLLGPASAGVYSVVLNFAAMPLTKVAPIINSIAFPAFALVQQNRTEAGYYVLKGIRMMAVLVVPVFFGIAAVAPEVVDIVFGPNWAAVRPLLPILSVALTFRAMLILLPNFLMGIGEPRASFWCTLTGTALFPAAVAVGCKWGLAGACWAWLICYPAVFVLQSRIASVRGGLAFRSLLLAPLQPMVSGAVMVACVTAVRLSLPNTLPETGRVALLVTTGAATYVTVMLLAFNELSQEVRALFLRRGAASRA